MRPESILDTRTTPTQRTHIITRWQSPHPALLAALLVTLLLVSSQASAATIVWKGTVSTSWNVAGNWFQDNNGDGVFNAGDTDNVAPVAGDDLVFPTPTTTQTTASNNFAAGTTFNSIKFNAAGYTVSGAQFNLSGGATALVNNAATGTNTISAAVTFTTANPTITTVTGGTLTFQTGAFNFGALTLTVNTAGTCNLNGVITASGSLIKDSGAGTLRLGAANGSFTGPITVKTGTLQAGAPTCLGSTSAATTIESGATLDLSGISVTLEPVLITGTGVGAVGALYNSTSTVVTSTIVLTLTGDTTIGGALAAGTINLNGVITGTNKIIKVGPNVLNLGANNDPTFSGSIDVNAGTLRLGNTGALGTDTSPTTVVSGAILDLNGISVASESLFINGTGSGAGVIINGVATTANINGPVTLQSASSIGGSNAITINGQIAGSTTLTKIGAGTLQINGDNSAFTGGVTLSAGTLQIGNNSALGLAGTFTISGGTIQATGGAKSIPNPVTVTTGFTISGSNDLAFGGSSSIPAVTVIVSNTGQTTIIGDVTLSGLLTLNVSTNLTFSGVISGSFGITKITGTGTVTLNGTSPNTYTGTTTISAGTLVVAKDQALGTVAGNTVINSASVLAFQEVSTYSLAEPITMSLGATDPIIRSISGNNVFPGVITISDTDTNVIDVVAGSLTISGSITSSTNNTCSLRKNGIGTLIVSGTISPNASFKIQDFNISSGAVKVSGAAGTIAAMGTNPQISIGSLATLELDNTTNQLADRVADANNITSNGGTLFLNGSPVTGAAGTESVGTLRFPVTGCTVKINAYGSTANATLLSTASAFDFTGGGNFNFERNSDPLGATAFLKLTGGTAGAVASATVNSLPSTYDTTNGLIEDLTSVAVSVQNGDWDTASTWSPAVVPDLGKSVYIKHNVTKNVNTARTVSSITLTTGGSGTPSLTGSNSINVGNGASGTLKASGVAGTISTPIDFGAFQGTVDVPSGGTLTVSGVITSSANGINKTGTGTAIFSGASANTYVGTTTVTAGTLSIDNDNKLGATANGITLNGGTLSANADVTLPSTRIVTLSTNGGTLDAAATKTFTLNSAITGNFALTKSGSGTVVLTQSSARSSGATTINTGILHVDNAAALGTTGIAQITVNGTLEIGNGVTFVNNMLLNNGATLQGVGTSTVATTSAIVNVAAGATVNIKAPALTDTFTIGNANNTIAAAAGTTVVFSGSGKLILKGPNSGLAGTAEVGTGVAQQNDTIVQIDLSTALPTATTLTVKIGGKAHLNADPNFLIGLSGGTLAPVNADRACSRAVTANSGTNSFISVNDGNTGQNRTLTISTSPGDLAGSGVVEVTSGSSGGTLVLRNTASTFQGTLKISANAIVQAFSAGTLGSSANRATVQLNGGTLQLRNSAAPFDFNANIQVLKDSIINLDRPGVTGFQQVLTLNSVGVPAGLSSVPTLTITNDSVLSQYLLSFIGTSTLNGELSISPDTLQGVTYKPLTFSGSIAGTGKLSQTGPGRIDLTSTNTFSGGLTVNGTTNLIGDNATLSCGVTVNSGGKFTIDDAGTTTPPADRLLDGANPSVTLNGGTFEILAKADNPRIENIGSLVVNAGESTVSLQTSSNADVQLVATTSSRAAGGLLKFVRGITGTAPNDVTPNLLMLDVSPGQTSGPDLLLPWASVYDGTTLVNTLVNVAVYKKYPVEDGVIPLSSASSYITAQDGNWNSLSTWVGGVVPPPDAYVTIRHGVALADNSGPLNITAYAVTFDQSGGSISGAPGVALTVASGSITVNGDTGNAITASISANLAFGTSEAFFNTLNSAIVSVNGVVSGTNGLTKLGNGTLVLSGANTYTPLTTLYSGTMALGSDGSLSTGTLSVYANTTIIPQNGTRTFNNAVTLKGAVTLGSSGATDIVFGGPVTVEQTSNIKVDGPSATFSGVIGNGSAGSLALSKNGAGALRLSGANTFSGGFTLTEGALQLGSNTALGTGSLSVSGAGASIEAVNGARTLANPLTITFDTSFIGSQNLSFTGPISIAGGSKILTFDNAGVTSFDGVVSGSKIIKRGAGTLKLTNANTFSSIDLNEGTLQVGHNSALGGGTMQIQNVAVLEAVGTGPRIVPNALAIDSNFSFIGSVDMTVGGTATLSGNRTISVNTLNATLSFASTTDSSGTYSLTKSGVGTLTLTGANSIDGNLIADGGVFNMKGDTATLSGGITVNTGGTFTIDGQGTADINRISDAAAGIITLNGGTFKMTAPATADRTETINKLVLKAGTTSTVELVTQRTVDATTGDCRLTATTYTREAGASLRFTRTFTNPGPVPNLKLASLGNIGLPWATVNFLRAKHDTVEGIVPAAEGDAWITTKSGNWNDSTVWTTPTTYTDTDTYPGQTNTGAEVIIRHTVDITHATQQVSTVTIDDTAGAGIINSTAGTTLQVLGGGIYIVDKQPGTSFTHQINCPISFPDSAGPTVTEGLFLQASSGATADILDVSGAISSASHGGVAVNGTGLVRFTSGGNAYTGQTGLFGGTLSIQNDNHLGNTSNALVLSGGALQVRGTNNTIPLNASRSVTIGASGGTFDIQSSNTLNISVALAGSGTPNGPLNKTGAGTLILSGTSTRVGPANITGGTVKLDNASGLGAVGTTAALTNATLWLNGISLNMPIALNSGSTLQGSGITESIGTMTVANNAAVTLVADPGSIFTIGSNPNVLVGGGGTSSITVNGTGRVILTDSNTYTGSWTRNSGILQVNSPTSLGSGATTLQVNGPGTFASRTSTIALPITLSNGATLAAMNGDRTFTGPITVTGAAASTISMFDPVNGTSDWNITLTGTLTGTSAPLIVNASGSPSTTRILALKGSGSGFTQPVTVNAGVLRLQNSGSLGGNITINSGGVLDLDDTGSATPVNRIGDTATLSLNSAKLTFSAQANVTHDEVFGTLTIAGNSTITMTPNSSAAGMGDLQIHAGSSNLGSLGANKLTFYRNTSGTETANLFSAGVTEGPVNNTQVFETLGPGPGKYEAAEGLRSTFVTPHTSVTDGNWSVSQPFTWSGGGAVTVAFWTKVNTGQVQNSFAFGVGAGGGGNRFSAHVPWSDGNIYWDYGDINGSGRISTAFGALDVWKHIALVSSGTGNTFKAIYIDGVLAASAANSHGPSGTLSPLFVGASPESPGSQFQRGLIDDFRIYNRMLDATEIATLAASGSVATPVVHFPFDENSGLKATDSIAGYTGSLMNGAGWVSGTNAKVGTAALSLDGSNDYVYVPNTFNPTWDTGANPPPTGEQVIIDGHTVSLKANNESITNVIFNKPGTINRIGGTARTLTVDSLGVIQVNTTNNGLKAEYFQNNAVSGSPALTRFDPNVDYNINAGGWPSPLANTNFSVRWTGFVTPQFTETYTFYVGSDDGARLIINGVTLFDRLSVGQGETEANQIASVDLVAGVPVSIRLEYQQGGGGAACHLRWSSASTPKQVIPQSALSAPTGYTPPVSTISVDSLAFTGSTGFINFSNNGSLIISSVIPGAFTTGDGLKIIGNSGDLTLSGANTYTGRTTLSSGTLYFGNTTALGSSDLFIESGAIGALPSIGTLTNPINAVGNFAVVGSNPLAMSGNMLLSANRSIDVRNTASTTFSGAISDGAGSYSLAKNGTGLLILSGSNTYEGGTAVNTGTLQANLPGTSATGTGPVTVASGATLTGTGNIAGTATIDSGATLSGTLNITGAVTIADNAIVSPATPTTGGAIGTGPLLIANNAILNFNLPTTTTNDRFNVAGSCSIGGVMNIDTVNAFGGPGTYPIVVCTAGTVTDTGLLVTVPGYSYTITGSGTSTLNLVIATPARKVWDGGGANDNWTTAANWFQDNNSNNVFDGGDANDVAPLIGDILVFAGTVRLTPYNNFPEGTPFSSITFAGNGFTVSGNSIKLNGAAAAITNSTGANNLNVSVAMPKDITIAAADATALTVNGNIDNGGFRLTLNPGDSGTITINGVVSGTGGLTTSDPVGNGGGTITLNAANTYSGSNTPAYFVPGLLAEYYQNTALTAPPTLVRIDPKIDSPNIPPATWPNPLANTNFSVRWTGKITPPQSGTYRFDPRTDDGVRLWVNNVLLVNQWVGRGVPGQEAANNFGDIALTGGVAYDIKMEFYQGSGGYGAYLYYRTTDNAVPYQIVPQAVLSAPISSNTATILNGEGTVVLGNDSALGVSNVVYNNSSTKLQASAPRTIANSVILNSNATINGSDLTFTSTVPIVMADRSITVNNANTYFTASPPISGVGYALTKQGLGQMVISGGTATFTKQLTVGAGTVKLTGAGALSSFGNNPVIISSGATLDLDNGTTVLDRIVDANKVQLNSGSTLLLRGSNTADAVNEAVGELIANSSTGVIKVVANGGDTRFTFTNYSGAATINFDRSDLGGNPANSPLAKAFVTNSTLFAEGLGLTFATVTDTPAGLTNVAAKYLTANGIVPAYTGGTYISLRTGNWDDPTMWSPNGNPGANDVIIVDQNHVVSLNSANRSAALVRFTASGQITGANTLTSGSFIEVTGNGSPVFDCPVQISGVTITQGSSGTLEFKKAISGTNGILKIGTGRLQLSAANSYSGATYLNAGTIAIGANGVFGSSNVLISGSPFEILGNYSLSNTITLSSNLVLSGAGNLTLSGNISLNNADRVFTVSNPYLLCSGVISDGGGNRKLTKNGLGELELTNANTNSANPSVQLDNGTITVGNNAALGTNRFLINAANVTLKASAPSLTLANPVDIGNNFIFEGNNDLTLSSSTVQLTGDRTITINGSRILTLTNGLKQTGGNRGLNKAGTGTLELRNASTFANFLRINNDGGTLRLAGDATLADMVANPAITIGSNALLDIDNTGTTLGGTTAGLKAEYFQNIDLLGSAVMTRIDANIDFDIYVAGWPTPLGQNNFSVRWSGKFTPPVTGTYRFDPRTDDGVRLRVNGVQLVNQWVGRGAPGQEVAGNYGDIDLVGGTPYDIQMDYYQGSVDGSARLYYRTLDNVVPYQIVPSSVLSTPLATSRIADTDQFLLNGGSIRVKADNNKDYQEVVGSITFNTGSNTITLIPTGFGTAQIRASGGLSQSNGAQLNLVRNSTTPEGNLFATGFSDNESISWAFVNGLPAMYDLTPTDVGVVPNTSNIKVSAGTGNWNAITWRNYAGGTTGIPGTGDDVIIRHQVTLDANRSVRSVIFDSGTTDAGTLSPQITGANTLTIESGNITATGTATPTIGCNVLLSTLGNINQSSTGTLTISGLISSAAGSSTEGTSGYWKFDENTGTTTADSGGSNNGTLTNSPVWVSGGAQRVGTSALSFNGTNQYVSVPSFNWAGGAVTVAFWTKDTGTTQNSFAFGVGSGGNTNRFSAHVPWSDGNIYWDYGNIGVNGRISTSYGGTTSNWKHITLVSAGSTGGFKAIYINGTLVASATVSDSVAAGATNLEIGRSPESTGGNYHKGSIDDFRIYNRVLTESEISLLAGGRGTDGTGLTKSGSGTLVLSNTSNSYTGSTTVLGGTLQVSNDGVLGNANNSVNLNGGTLKLAAALTTPRLISIQSAGGTIDNDTFDLTLSQPMFGVGNLTKQGSGSLIMTAPFANAISMRNGTTTLNGGTTQITASTNGTYSLLGSGAVTANAATLSTSFSTAANERLPNPLNLNNNAILRGTGNMPTSSFTNNIITIGSGANVTIDAGASDASTVFRLFSADNQLRGGGNGSTITMPGAGRVAFMQNNSSGLYVGTFQLNGGAGSQLQLNNSNSLANAANLLKITSGIAFANGAITCPNPIELNGGTITTNNQTVTWSGNVSVTASSTINTNGFPAGAAGAMTFSGILSGSAPLQVTGSGTLRTVTFTNPANTYSGTMTSNSVLAPIEFRPAGSPALSGPPATLNMVGTKLNLRSDGNTAFSTNVSLTPVTAPSVGDGSANLLTNVPEAAGYKLVYQLSIPTSAAYNTTAPSYSPNNSGSITYSFDRIAYYMELTNGSGTTWAYVSMDAFTTDVNRIGVPCTQAVGGAYMFQQLVNNLNVYSNVAGVVNGTGITTGNIEFWPSNYGAGTTTIVPGGSGSTLDFNDSGAGTGAGYGSMQIHNYGASQTIIAYNHWTSGTSEVGIGNSPTGNPDYTFTNNAGTYTVRSLQVLVRPAISNIDVNNQSSGTGNTISLNNLSIGADTLNVTGGNSYRAAFAGTTTMSGNATFNPTSADLTLGGVVGGGAFNITKTGAGSLTLNAANTYTGITSVKAGTLFLGNNTALGTGSGTVTLMDGPTNANASILATGPYTIGRNISVNNTAAGKATLGATNTSGTATFSGGITLLQNLSLTAAAGGTVNFSGLLSDGASSYQVTKEGNGTVALSNLTGNAYDSGTTVSTGTLQVNNTSGSGTGTGAVTVNGTSLLRGTGLITGAVNIAASTGSVWPGTTTLNSDTKQTLTAASANFGTNGSKLTVRATSTGPTGSFTADKLTITGSGTPLVLGGASTLYIDFATAAGNYTNFQSNPILQTNAGELITSPFTNITVVSGGAPYTGSGLTILYLNSAGTTVATQQTNGSVTSTSFTANRIVLNLNGTVTPATIATFSAKADGSGALVEWDCSSEYDNLGFNVWRRAFGSEDWSKVNSHMIAGRITSPEGKRYSFYDWNAAEAAEQVEYRLESVSVRGEHEFYKLFAGPIAVAADAPEISLESLASAIDSALTEVRAERAMAAAKLANEPQQFALESAVPNAEPAVKSPPMARATELRAPRISSRAVASNSITSNTEQPLASSHAVGARSVAARSITASAEAVKVVYSGSGVLFVPSAALPVGYDVNFLSITREGKSVTALALLPDGLLLYAPGYADDYTDKDAFFLSASTTPTTAGTNSSAQNLFDGSAAANTAPATALVEYHDVYYDYNMLPLVFPPWFSDKYLTQGSVQSFSLSTPNLASGTATLTIDLWSMTQSSAVDPDHSLQAFVNGNAVGSVSWDGGNKAMSLSFTIPDGVLRSGANTIELLTPDLGFEQLSMLHAISIDYVQALTANAPTTIVSTAAQRFELSGLANANIWIVNTSAGTLTPSEAQAQADGSFNVRFDAAANTTYLAVPQGSEIAPLMVAARTIKPLNAGITYLVVGPKQFAAEIQPLLSTRSKQGLVTAFVDQEELFDCYGFGRYGPDPIRKAVRSIKPQYLLLVGRTTYDYRDYAPPSVDPLCPGFLISTTYHSQTISDPRYGDLGKGYPEICVGRFPVNTPEELSVAIAHTLAYKGLPISGQRALMVADEFDPKAGDFALLGDGVIASSPEIAWQKAYLKVTHATSADVTESMRQAASGGADLIVFTGHGTSAGLGLNAPKMLDANLVQSWTGNIVLLQATCNGNWVGRDTPGYKSIATQALTQPQGGIAASISTTTYLTAAPAAEFMQQLIRQYSTDGQTWGQALLKTQQWAYQKSKTGKGVYADMTHTESILGDPALPMYPRINIDGGYVDNGSPNNPGTGTGDGGGTGGTNPVPPGGGNQNGGGATLTVTKLVGKVLYRVAAHDNIAVSGFVSNLLDTNTAGMSVTLNIGGVTQQFVLDGKGNGRTKNGAFKLGPATTNGVRIFRATLKGALAGNWTDEGISSTSTSGSVAIAVDLMLGSTTCSTNVSTAYKNVNGKAGRLQKSK